jgi:hypothetical protein
MMALTSGPGNVIFVPNKSKRTMDYVILFLLVAQTSMPFFIGDEFLVANFVLSLALFIYRRKTFDYFISLYAFTFLLIFVAQSLFFKVYELNVIMGYLLRILYAYLTIKLVGRHVARYYVNIIYFFTIISFIFYFPSLLFQEQALSILQSVSKLIEPFQLHESGRHHILIYTFGEAYGEGSGLEGLGISIERNSGPFWEPGGFGVFLILALIFQIIHGETLLSKRNRIFILAIITTLSTGAFICLFLLAIFYFATIKSPKMVLYSLTLIVVSFFIYTNTFFLTNKISTQVAYTKSRSLTYAPRSRFVSAQLDLVDFLNNPVLGRGRFEATRFDVVEDNAELQRNHRNNGTTNMLVEFGLFGFLMFFYFMHRSFKAYCLANNFSSAFAYYAVATVLLLGFSQMIFIKPFFIALSFMFLAAGYKVRVKQAATGDLGRRLVQRRQVP